MDLDAALSEKRAPSVLEQPRADREQRSDEVRLVRAVPTLAAPLACFGHAAGRYLVARRLERDPLLCNSPLQ
jgi:hypothetical protein